MGWPAALASSFIAWFTVPVIAILIVIILIVVIIIIAMTKKTSTEHQNIEDIIALKKAGVPTT